MFLVSGSLFSVVLFGVMVGVLSSSLVNQSGIVTQSRVGVALGLMWIGVIGITTGGSLYFSKS